jgi:hypothetical protein
MSLPASSEKLLTSVYSFREGNHCVTKKPFARMWANRRVKRIRAGANEIRKEMTGPSR